MFRLKNTSKEFDEKILSGRSFAVKAKVKFLDGTILNLTNEDIMSSGGIQIDDATTDESTFTVGSAIINELILILNNFNHKFDNYDFYGAIIWPAIGLQLTDSIEWIDKGVFTVDDPTTPGSTINIKALDNMYKFDREFSRVSISLPCNVGELAYSICVYCGVTLKSTVFDNSDYIINSIPADQAATCREMISYIAQVTGNFARCNTSGELEIKWYDIKAFETEDSANGGNFIDYSSGDTVNGGSFTDYSSGNVINGGTFLNSKRYHHIFSYTNPKIGTDDVVITGVKVEAFDDGNDSTTEEEYLFGTEGYVISISENPLIPSGKATEVANRVGSKIVGMRFRTFSVSAYSDPRIEAGDAAYLSDRHGNSYQTLITNVNYSYGNYEGLACNAESPISKSSVRFSAATKTIVEARNRIRQEKNSREQAIDEMNNKLSNAKGLYHTEETLQDKSKVYYLHDKPTLAESQIIWKMTAEVIAVSTDGGKTYSYGVSADGNAILNRIEAIGINADWIKSGTLTGRNINNGDGTFTVNPEGRMTATSGKIGPFELRPEGLFSKVMELYENNNYPLIWLTKPGANGWGSENSARANLEPSVVVVRAVEDSVLTEVAIMARDDTSGTKGQLSITREQGGTLKSNLKLSPDGGMEIDKYTSSGGIDSVIRFTDNNLLIQKNGTTFNVSIGDGEVFMSADKLYINGNTVNINGHEF